MSPAIEASRARFVSQLYGMPLPEARHLLTAETPEEVAELMLIAYPDTALFRMMASICEGSVRHCPECKHAPPPWSGEINVAYLPRQHNPAGIPKKNI